MAGDNTPCTTAHVLGFLASSVWKAGHTLPRFAKLDKKTAIRAFGAIQITVSIATPMLFHMVFARRSLGDRDRFFQIISYGRGARRIEVPSGCFLRAA